MRSASPLLLPRWICRDCAPGKLRSLPQFAQAALSEEIAVDLRAQRNRAVAILNGTRRVAQNMPVQVSAARSAVQQATARYQAGLGNIDELAEAQRLLNQAEIDDALARLNIWRGLFGIATAAGDIQPFVVEASR